METAVVGRAASEEGLREAVRAADAVLVSGGGNLSDSWPELAEQRAIVLEEAASLGRPAVVAGQSLGPNLSGPLAERVGAALRTAVMVGVRDRASR